jgi:putative two-component system response regulator
MTAERPTILIVDDQPENLAVLAALLQPHFWVRAARSGEQAIRAATTTPLPDLALLDIMMPGMDGYEVLARLRAIPEIAEMPVVFITALGGEDDEQRGLEHGAVDYVTKPIKPGTVLARVRTHLELGDARRRLREQNAALEDKVAERTEALHAALKEAESAHAQLKKTHFGTLVAIGDLAGLRGAGIGEHSRRVADFARQVAFQLGMKAAEAQDVFIAALLHDIGKIGFPDALLRKSVSSMTHDELVRYQQHPVAGAELIGKIGALSDVAKLIRAHHELYNGSGFPARLTGLNIPLGARIIGAVSDYEDLKSGTMSSRPLLAKASFQYLIECAGSRYDPRVIEAFEPIASAEGRYEIEELVVNVKHLQEGMILTRDVRDSQDCVLLAKGTVLSRSLIDQLIAVEQRSTRPMRVHIERRTVEHAAAAKAPVPPPDSQVSG